MFEVAVDDFLGRVVTSHERVGFCSVDAYGHLNTSRYLEIFVDHRVHAPEDMQGISTMALAKQEIGLFFTKSTIEFLRPTALGETIAISSWVRAVSSNGFIVSGIFYGAKRRDLKTLVQAEVRSVNLKSGRTMDLPRTLPCTSNELLKHLPLSKEFALEFKTIPEEMY